MLSATFKDIEIQKIMQHAATDYCLQTVKHHISMIQFSALLGRKTAKSALISEVFDDDW